MIITDTANLDIYIYVMIIVIVIIITYWYGASYDCHFEILAIIVSKSIDIDSGREGLKIYIYLKLTAAYRTADRTI